MRPVILVAIVSLLIISASACGGAPAPVAAPAKAPVKATATAAVVTTGGQPVEKEFEELNPDDFANPTLINNEWFPMKPGMQWVFEGFTNEGGQSAHHRLIFTVTDLTKVIEGVRTVVGWIVDYSDGEVVEKEIAFYAQDNEGTVWYLGEYPEAYENGKIVDVPTWIHGIADAKAGIQMKAKPYLGMPSYSEGWGPDVDFTDRARVDQMGHKISTPYGNFQGVLTIAETNKAEPDAVQLKTYARGVGKVQVAWRGADKTKEALDLVELTQLGPEALAQARAEALEVEKRAYEFSKDVYAQTQPMETAESAMANPASKPAQPAARPTRAAAVNTVSFEIGTATGAKEWKYSTQALEAPAGSTITLKFSNNTDPKDEVGHNWVLVKLGQEDKVIANAKAAGDVNDWLKNDDPGIIAHTKLIEGSESDTITFDAPPPGVYTFLCTFPDHSAGGMKGTLTIK